MLYSDKENWELLYTTVHTPRTLVIHLYNIEYLNKLFKEKVKPTPIEFKINEKIGEKSYRLTGMVLARSGHYTTIAYVPEKEEWYNFNDEKVRPDPNLKNLGDDRNVPYLFFYTIQE